MYNAFVSTPIQQNSGNSQFMSPLGPMTSDLTMSNNMLTGYIPNNVDPNVGYNNYINVFILLYI